MKNILLIIAVIGFAFNATAQKRDYEELYNRLRIEQQMERVGEIAIEAIADQRPEVTAEKWATVKSNLNFKKFKKDYIAVYQNNYTPAEVKEIFLQNEMVESVNDTGLFLFEPKNQEVKEQLYGVGKKAGRDIMLQIVNLLK